MASFKTIWIGLRARLMAWQQGRLFDLWRNELQSRRGY